MKKITYISFVVFACLSCVKEADCTKDLVGDGIKEIIVNLPDYIGFNTKSIFNIDSEGVKVLWAENDSLGIFPEIGDQIYFPMISGAGSSSAKFDGGGWGLKDASSYSAYFPFNRIYYSQKRNSIKLPYDGQSQDGNGNPANLSLYDYLASGPASPQYGYLQIDLCRLGSIACFNLTVPEPGTYSTAVISSDVEFITAANLDATVTPPVVSPTAVSNKLTLKLNNLTTSRENENVTLYMMLSPINLTQANTFTIALYGENHSFIADLPKKNLQAGKPYMFVGSEMTEAISFKDETVKSICVANWDSNENGELDYCEAEAVTDISTLFSYSRIKSFDELRYFTSITFIPDNAFRGCSSLTTIDLPESITTIGNYSFQSCSSLISLGANTSFNSIGNNSFDGCRMLSGSISINEDAVSIPQYAFNNCELLSEISIPSSVKSIGQYAFCGCKSINSINLPSNLEYIDSHAFDGCTSITSFDIPDNAIAGPYGLFASCTNLTDINIPSSWLELGDDFFNGCRCLQAIALPEKLRRIGDRCFNGCSSLSSIILPESLLVIAEGCFSGCTSLESITIPSKVTTITSESFSGCSSLTNVILPEGLISIASRGRYAFNDCVNLKQIILPESLREIGPYAFISCGLESIVIPNNVSFIDIAAFERCYDLEHITLSTGLKTIELNLFSHTKLKELTIPESVEVIMDAHIPETVEKITVLSTVPPTLYDDGNSVIPHNECPIYVPAESVDTYKNAPNWCNYSERIEAISDSSADNPQPGTWE